MDANLISYKISSLYQKFLDSKEVCNSLDKKLHIEIEGTEYLSENAEELAILLREVLSVLKTHLELKYFQEIAKLKETIKSLSDYDEQIWDEKYRRLERRLFVISDIAAKLTPLLKFVFGAKAENNPWGLVTQVDVTCRNLNPNARVIVRPRWEYNYSYYPITRHLYDLSEYAEEADSSLKKAISSCIYPRDLPNSPVYASLAYPPIAARNILDMAIWGHEIGHFIDNIEGIRLANNEEKNKPSNFLSVEKARKLKISVDSVMPKLKKLVGISLNGDTDASTEEELDIINERINKPIFRYLDYWALQVFADLFSVRMFGPAALFSFVEYNKPIDEWINITGPEHISIRTRLKIMMNAYQKWYGTDFLADYEHSKFRNYVNVFTEEIEKLKIFSTTDDHNPVFPTHIKDNDFFQIIYPYFYPKITEISQVLEGEIERLYTEKKEFFLTNEDFHLILLGTKDLEDNIPPDYSSELISKNETSTTIISSKILPLVVNSGWLHWLLIRSIEINHNKTPNQTGVSHLLNEFEDTNILLLKSIENVVAQEWFDDRKVYGSHSEKTNRKDTEVRRKTGGVLSRQTILNRLDVDLFIRPLLSSGSQIGTCSVDVRLGNTFILAKHPSIPNFDLSDPDIGSKSTQFQSKLYLPFGKPFVLQPRQFVLANTLEYISMPDDLMGLVVDRESWGRLGLVMVTTFKIVPGYRGCVTLSLTNMGNAPIMLYPCARIGQILFYNIA